MRIRTKIILTILAACLYFWIQQHSAHSVHESASGSLNLKAAYQEFNQQYFYNRLPKDVLLDFSEKDDYMATTTILTDGRFHVAFNPKYVNAQRTMRETMLHEQCHVKTFKWELGLEDIRTRQHGREWRACMLQLDTQGAFRRELIDYYEGN